MIWRARLVLAPAIALTLVSILMSTAAGPASAFPTQTLYDRNLLAPGTGPIAAGDVDGDGLTDILAADNTAGVYELFLQTPMGLPANSTLSFRGPVARELVLADVDGNATTDIVSLGASAVTIFYQGAGWFGQANETVPTSGGTDVAIGDLNGDGAKDLVVLTTGEFRIWFQNPTQHTWLPFASLNITASGYHDLVVADLRNDGLPDLILAKPYELRIFAQTEEGLDLNGTRMSLDTSDAFASLALDVVKVDGDAFQDIVVSEVTPSFGSGEISVYLQKEAAFNLSPKLSGPFSGPFAVGDLNDDGVADLAAAMHDRAIGKDWIAVFVQHFTGGFEGGPSFMLTVDGTGGATGIAIGRFSGRPFNDLVARTQGALLVYEQEDSPPVLIRAIPSDFSFNVGASGAGLIDLRNYFADDHGVLRFDIRYQGNVDRLHAALATDGYHLDFVAERGWYGPAEFKVAASDGVPGHPWIDSNTFSVTVNALPWFTSPYPKQVYVGERLLYQVTIADPYPVEDAHVFSLLEAPAGMTIDGMTGLMEWTPTASDVGVHGVRIQVADSYGGSAEQSFSIEVLVAPVEPPTSAVVAVTALGALAALGAGSVASENVKYGLLTLFIPLYSKIKREQVLDHFVRGQIYGYVLANPGEHYNAIKLALNLTNGSLAHHLKTLEREQFIKSRRFGLYRRFYPMHMKIPEEGFFTPNEIQKTIVDLIRTTPAITQKEIAERLGLTPPTVNYHVGILSEHGAIRVERAGRKTHCFVVEAGPAAGASTPSGGPATPGPSAPRPPQ